MSDRRPVLDRQQPLRFLADVCEVLADEVEASGGKELEITYAEAVRAYARAALVLRTPAEDDVIIRMTDHLMMRVDEGIRGERPLLDIVDQLHARTESLSRASILIG